MNIAVIGAGYVGLVTGTCFAELGNNVICVDNDAKKIHALRKGDIPIFEPGLEDMVAGNMKEKRLTFGVSIPQAVGRAEIIFIAVGTPPLDNGDADLTGIENVARSIAMSMKEYRLIVEKSTVPVETGQWVKHTIGTYIKSRVPFDVASNPEFLREGSAIGDFMHPDRIVIGVESRRARDILTNLYTPLRVPIVATNIKSAELIKHASNAFLATKISFINAVSRLCDKVGADVEQVADGMGMDTRIGRAFLNAGAGYGGSCFPKDLDAFISISDKFGYDFTLLKEVRHINEEQKDVLLKKIKDSMWIIKDKTIAVLGLSFKPDTDDIRSSPALDVIRILMADGARIRAYDPQAMDKVRPLFPRIKYCRDAYDACRGADCAVFMTEWNEFKELDFQRLKKSLRRPCVIDGRNMYEPEKMKELGIGYSAMGRGIK